VAEIMKLPKIGVNMTEAVISEWLVEEGDKVEKDSPLLTAETDKALQEIYATMSGILAKKLVKLGDTVKIQDPIAVFIEPGEKFDDEYK